MSIEPPPSWRETAARATLSAIPYVGGSVAVVWEDVRKRRAAAAGTTIEGIVNAVGGEQELAKQLAENPLLETLFVNAVDAAIRTGLDSKRRLLVRAVAQAANDVALLDDSMVIADVLAQLDAPHVQALKRMADEWDEAQRQGGEEASWGTSEVWRQTPAAVRAALIRTGTALQPSVTRIATAGPNRQEGISDFGLELVHLLEQEGTNLNGA